MKIERVGRELRENGEVLIAVTPNELNKINTSTMGKEGNFRAFLTYVIGAPKGLLFSVPMLSDTLNLSKSEVYNMLDKMVNLGWARKNGEADYTLFVDKITS